MEGRVVDEPIDEGGTTVELGAGVDVGVGTGEDDGALPHLPYCG